MRRVAAALLAIAATAAVLLATGAAGDRGDPYLVRAVFDNASFIIPGEDVRIGGVVVGAIEDVDLTEDNKAAVVLRIDDPAFRPFRRDARCRIALQSLIGEQFVECTPAAARGGNREPAPPLRRIASGRGAGQHLLPVENNETPVNVDLINNIMRVPQRERLRLIINELGAGLAANGPELRRAIRRANPALQQADRLVKTLAEQDRLLARLVDASDRVLEPLAERRRDLGGFIEHAGATAKATAEEGDDLERSLQRLPAFLRELGPAAERFGELADEMRPAIDGLGDHAPAVNEAVRRFGPFAEAATPAFQTLGDLARKGRGTFPQIGPVVEDIGRLARPLRPLARDLARLAGSFDDAGGIEELMRFIYFYTGAVNGKDEVGHYVRAALGVNACAQRVSTPGPGCASTFDSSGETQEATAASAPESALADYLLGQEAAR
jgi:ABC-type transporter Mla subunit MlaD